MPKSSVCSLSASFPTQDLVYICSLFHTHTTCTPMLEQLLKCIISPLLLNKLLHCWKFKSYWILVRFTLKILTDVLKDAPSSSGSGISNKRFLDWVTLNMKYLSFLKDSSKFTSPKCAVLEILQWESASGNSQTCKCVLVWIDSPAPLLNTIRIMTTKLTFKTINFMDIFCRLLL